MATNPLSAFFEGFQGARQATQQRERQAQADALNQQLRDIQLMKAQQEAAQFPMQQALLVEQLKNAMMTPEQKAVEDAKAAYIQRQATQPGVIFQEGGPVEEISPEAQEIIGMREAAPIPFTREGIPGIEMQTAVPGLPGAVRSPAALRQEQEQARTNAALKRELEGPEKLEFKDVGDAVVGFNTITGAEVSRTPKVPGKELTKTARGLFEYNPLNPSEGRIIPGTEPETTPGVYSTEQQRGVTQLTDRYNRNDYVKKAVAAQGALDVITEGLKQKNSTGDIAAINQFQSGLVDPGATVREGDVKLMVDSTALSARLSNYLPRLIKGGVLPPEMRAEMEKTAKDIYKMRAVNVNKIANTQFKSLAPKFGIQFEDVGREFPEDLSAPNAQSQGVVTTKSGNKFQLAK